MRKNLLTGALVLGLAVVSPLIVGGTVSAYVVPESDTYTLSGNLTEGIKVPAGRTVTINLNGHNINSAAASEHGILIEKGATATIVGPGTVDAGNVDDTAAVYNRGDVTIKGGTFTKDDHDGAFYTLVNRGNAQIDGGSFIQTNSGGSSLVENGYYSYPSGTPEGIAAPKLVINGGTFTGGTVAVKNDEGGTLEINDGDFHGVNGAVQNWHKAEINGGTFTMDRDSVN